MENTVLSSVILISGDAQATCTLCVMGSTDSVTGLSLRSDWVVSDPVTLHRENTAGRRQANKTVWYYRCIRLTYLLNQATR